MFLDNVKISSSLYVSSFKGIKEAPNIDTILGWSFK
jgi:hypothetical protein